MSSSAEWTAAGLGLVGASWLLFFLVSLLPAWRKRRRGCDAYYFLLSAEELRRSRRLPLRLPPYYLADIEEQWYPPGFTVLLALLPQRFVERFYWLVNYLLDFANLLVLDLLLWRVGAGPFETVAANVAYTLSPVSAREYFSLTSRSLGNLLFSLFAASLWLADGGASGWWTAAACLTWLVILLTHKLTMQLGVAYALALSVLRASWLPAAVALGGIAAAWLLTGGWYWKVLKGHWDIVSFWHRNLPWLGAHQVRSSPVYGTLPPPPGPAGILRRAPRALLTLFMYNPVAWAAPVLLLPAGAADAGPFSPWLLTALAWALATTWVPYLTALGEGYRYVKYAGLPAAALVGLGWGGAGAGGRALLLAAAAVSAVGILRAARDPGRAADGEDADFRRLLDFLREHPEVDRIGCLSAHLADPLVWFARRRVLWGTHHYLFNEKVVRFFPVLRRRLGELSREFGLGYWLLDSRYARPEDVELEGAPPVASFGPYLLYRSNSGTHT